MAIWTSGVAEPTVNDGPTGVTTYPEAPESVNGRVGSAGPLVEVPRPEHVRQWLFPGADELYRSIYSAVTFDPVDVLAVTSSIAGEGKTTTAVGIAVTAAQDAPGRRILLIEADLDRPVLASDFDVEPNPGLVDCLLSDEPVQSAYRTTFLPNLHLMPAGVAIGGNGRLLRSSQTPQILESIRRSYDLVIVDGPAILANSDAARLSDLTSGTIFVIRSGVTPSGLVRQALDRIDESKLRGVVLNGQASAVPGWLRRLTGL